MNGLLLALDITMLGMGLVFAALILLWWLMTLLTRLTANKEPSPESTAASGAADNMPVMQGDVKARAAAIAVAIAMAEQQASSAHPLTDPPTAIISAWQLGMRTRQLYQKSISIRRRAG